MPETERLTPERIIESYKRCFPRKPRLGFDVGPGWIPVLDHLCSVIDFHLERHPVDRFDVEQVKEKFGGLRFYVQGADEFIRGAISMAEVVCSATCESCGRPGQGRSGGWIVTMCDPCWQRREEKRSARNAKD